MYFQYYLQYTSKWTKIPIDQFINVLENEPHYTLGCALNQYESSNGYSYIESPQGVKHYVLFESEEDAIMFTLKWKG